jgi:hypothetical protein
MINNTILSLVIDLGKQHSFDINAINQLTIEIRIALRPETLEVRSDKTIG